jgi:hypothetical protein
MLLQRSFLRRSALPTFAVALFSLGPIAFSQVGAKAPAGTPQDVLTYHGDALRTGWFSNETLLTASNVNAQSFGLLQTVPLDGRVDAEPLVALQQTIQGQGVHNVVYVATENNSVYAIDADSGVVLWQVNLGTPAPDSYKNDDNVYPMVGILSTPVIDRSAGTSGVMYVLADIYNGSVDSFQLHALSLSSGNDLGHVTIQFSAKLLDGTTWTFGSQYNLQRPGLLEANGNIYVAIGGNGDGNPTTRGALVVYNATTLKKLDSGLTNRLNDSADNFYMSSIWMSGYGVATDASGDVYFATGNSDPTKPSYNKSGNYPESVLRVSGDLKTLHSSFTPYFYFTLDQNDLDVSSGGVLLLPDQLGNIPHLAVASAKWGTLFLLNRDSLGGYTAGGPDRVVQELNTIGSCWCGPAYFVGSDGIPRVLTGGAAGVISYQLQTSPTTQLVFDSTTGPNVVNGLPDNGGTIPVVSSNGTTPGSAIVWFVQRPATSSDQDPGTPVTLYAYAGSDLSQGLFSAQAGTWTHAVNSNANIVPTVANGKVYVASNEQLQIFGLLSSLPAAQRAAARKPALPSAPTVVTCPPEVTPLAAVEGTGSGVHQLRGTVCKVTGNQLQVALAGQRSISVDITTASSRHHMPLLTPGRPIKIRASIDEKGIAHAQRISRGHATPGLTQ